MPINKDPSTPPPMIGKIGPYTVFMTPPSTPSPMSTATNASATNESKFPVFDSPKKVVSPPPPVQPPPQQIDKSVYSHQVSDGSVLGFFKNAVNKVQNAHSSLDDHLARWLGLNQSKYQWALDDYYETKGLEKEGAKAKEISSKVQSV
ncbi:proline-rich receptor protein [Salix suchowensis]|nr:proline-rich receptor protein [Salix suchowensis]